MVSEYEYDVYDAYDAYDAYDVMYKYIYTKQTSPQVQAFMEFVGKYPLEVQLAQPVLVNSNWVLRDLNITDLSHMLRLIGD